MGRLAGVPKRSKLEGLNLDSFYTILSSVLGKAAQKVVPKCNVCGLNAVPLACESCGQYACLEHVWLNAKRQEALCEACVSEAFGDDAPEESEEDATPGANPWAVLGVGPESSLEDVKRAFRRKALKCHPDQGGSAAKFQELKRAYDAIVKLFAAEEQ